jgi:hypothetical protein
MLRIKEIYHSGRKMVVGDCKRTHFWLIPGVALHHRKKKIPNLFEMCNERDLPVVADANNNWRFTFRRWIPIDLQAKMRGLDMILCSINLNSILDKPGKWSKDGSFSVKSLYKQL